MSGSERHVVLVRREGGRHFCGVWGVDAADLRFFGVPLDKSGTWRFEFPEVVGMMTAVKHEEWHCDAEFLVTEEFMFAIVESCRATQLYHTEWCCIS